MRLTLGERLLARRDEIAQSVLMRVYAVSDPNQSSDPLYRDGLKTAVRAAVDFALQGIGRTQRDLAPVPIELLSQARLAAQAGVSLDTVMRRYAAGHSILADMLAEEAEASSASVNDLKHALRGQALRLERILAVVGDEYRREATARLGHVETRRADQVRRLLAGEMIDPEEIPYPFDSFHIALVIGARPESSKVRELATTLDRRLLFVQPSDQAAWAWLGGRSNLDADDVVHAVEAAIPDREIAIGEPAKGLSGWRLTHQQAAAALPIALKSERPIVRYCDVALIASVLRDELLVTSLRALYIEPLAHGSGEAHALRDTLRAYLAHDRNISSTASALRVSRPTVARRLRAAEKLLGGPLGPRALDVQTALRIDEFNRAHEPSGNETN